MLSEYIKEHGVSNTLRDLSAALRAESRDVAEAGNEERSHTIRYIANSIQSLAQAYEKKAS